jgi:SAM-dependent methyltransferase
MTSPDMTSPEMTSPGVNSRVAAVFEAPTPEVLARRYDELASQYDAELATDSSPRRAADVLRRYSAYDDRILDVGCGTGKVGEILSDVGYSTLEGLDISPGMLDEARKKHCYVSLHEQDLSKPLAFPDGTFDAVVSVGVFVRSHAPSSCFDELLRITRPGGYIVFTLRPEFYAVSDFKDKLEALTTDGRWRWLETGEPFNAGFKDFPDVNLQIWVYQVPPVP